MNRNMVCINDELSFVEKKMILKKENEFVDNKTQTRTLNVEHH